MARKKSRDVRELTTTRDLVASSSRASRARNAGASRRGHARAIPIGMATQSGWPRRRIDAACPEFAASPAMTERQGHDEPRPGKHQATATKHPDHGSRVMAAVSWQPREGSLINVSGPRHRAFRSRTRRHSHAHILPGRAVALAQLPAERSAAAAFLVAAHAAPERRARHAFARRHVVLHSLRGAVGFRHQFARRTERRLLRGDRRLALLGLRRRSGLLGLLLLCWRSRRTEEPCSLRTSSTNSAVRCAIRNRGGDGFPA